MTRKLCPFLSSIVAVLLAAVPAAAATIHVPADQSTIQAGIDAAAAGDTVLVAAGTYTGTGNRNLDFGGVDLVLLSEAGPEATVIDGNSGTDGEANGFIFTGGETPAAVVYGFTIKNCWAPTRTGYGHSGGGMFIAGASPTVIGCTFQDNSANGGNGGGIIVTEASSLIITGCTFTGNYTNNAGSAIYCAQNSSAQIISCVMEGNAGNGAITASSASASLLDCTIRGNGAVSSQGGAALLLQSGNIVASGCLITGNQIGGTFSRGGAALRMDGTSGASITGCTFSGNYAGDVGGAVLLAPGSDATLVLSLCVLWGDCGGNGGNEIYQDSSNGSIQVTCSDIDSTGVTATGITYDADTLFDDPLFCGPVDCGSAPTTAGDYTLAGNSPALDGNNNCGRTIGATVMGCGGITPARPTTWGSLKSRYLGD